MNENDLNLLAIDLGASSGRVMLSQFSPNGMRLEEVYRFPNGPISIANHLHWDVRRLFEEIKIGLRKAGSTCAINSLGLDTWGVDFALLDQHDKLIANPFHYRDPQTHGMMEEVFQRVDRKEIFQRTGTQFMQINTLYHLFANRDTPILEKAKTFLMMPDLFNYWLSGRKANEYTIATTTQFFNPYLKEYDRLILSKLSLPMDIYPGIVTPGTILGTLISTLGNDTGLDEIPVIAPACHDTASAVVSVPIKNPRSAYISSGTWSLMGVESTRPVITEQSLSYNFTNEGGVNGTFRLLKNVTGLWLIQECRRIWAEEGVKYSWDRITHLAEYSQGFASIIDVDDPVFLNPDHMPIAIQGYCKMKGQPVPASTGEIIRCIFVSLALKYRWVTNCLEEMLGETIEVIHIIGGGSQNQLLCQMTADATGKEVIAGPVEATAIGNALMQAIAIGYLGSLSEAREIVSKSFPLKRFQPDPSDQWDSAFHCLKELINHS